jgi:curved DNA-binding protein CbpA
MKRNIFDLVLEFYRSPVEHPELVNAEIPLPIDVGVLLDAISENKDPNHDLESPRELSADLRNAIPFFIERSFFVPGADCYRVLGLSVGAKAEQVRKHYNQLMHIFSLDRLDKSSEWDTAFATQINRAYSVLRDTERRRAYDQMLVRVPVTRETIGAPQEEQATEVARTAKAAPKVSYLASTKPAEEKQAQENQRRVLKGASTVSDRATAFEGMKDASSGLSKSAFIANRIDRASGIASDTAIADLGIDRESAVEDGSPQAEPEFSEHVPEHFPVGIPASGPREPVSSRNRLLSLDRSSLVLLAAVILVLIVYAIVLPGRFMGRSDSASEEVVSDRITNGNVIRESTTGGGKVAAAVDSANPGNGQIVLPGNDAASGAGEVTAQAEAAFDSAVGDEVESDNALDQPGSRSDTSQGTGTGGDDQRIRKVPARPSIIASLPLDRVVAKTANAPDKAASNAKKIEGQSVDSEGISPAKKLELMRQTLQKEPQVDNPVPAIQGSQANTRQVANAGAVSQSAPAQSTVLPMMRSRVDQPAPQVASNGEAVNLTASVPLTAPVSVDNSQSAGPDTMASIAPVTSVSQPQSITISELNGLVDTFSKAYESGDLDLLLTLFSDDARTNDQSSKIGIAKDYQDLFEISEKRKFIIDRLRWEQDKAGALKGEGEFQADVQLKSDNSVTSVKGKVLFYVKRGSDGIVITQMLHSYN